MIVEQNTLEIENVSDAEKKIRRRKKMSEVVVDSVVWNSLSLNAQQSMLKKHKAYVKSDYFTKDGRPRCAICGQGMRHAIDSKTGKRSQYEFEFACECVKKYPKMKDLRMCVG